MSRTVVFGALFATFAAVLLWWALSRPVTHFKPKGPIYIHFTCDTVNRISLTDSTGIPAWEVVRKRKEPISWIVDPNVTINSILQKDGTPMPLDSAGAQGGAPGRPYEARLKERLEKRDYLYSIDITCHPPTGPDVRLVVDPLLVPDMILR